MSKLRKTRRATTKTDDATENKVPTGRNGTSFRNEGQSRAVIQYAEKDIIILIGPPGTGKTYCATYLAWRALCERWVERVLITRPQVEVGGRGSRLGFMPGDMKEKMDPWMKPFLNSLRRIVGDPRKSYRDNKLIAERIISESFEVNPLDLIQGDSWDSAVSILDEAQNATIPELHQFLTRIGENGKIILSGDPRQSFLPGGGRHLELLADELEREGVAAVIRFTSDDIVRHRVIASIERVFDRMREKGGR